MKTLKSIVLSLLVITLATAGYAALLTHTNARIEARCSDRGGQVLLTPGYPSRCLLPVAR